MSEDAKRQALRHLVATVAYRCGIAIIDAPEDFAAFRINEDTRTPAELMSHIGDLLAGSLYLLKGETIYLNSTPLLWSDEVSRFFSAVQELDAYLESSEPLACPVEKLIQGPVGDALTHVGQIVMLRRAAGKPVRAESYFTAEIVPGTINKDSFSKVGVRKDFANGGR